MSIDVINIPSCLSASTTDMPTRIPEHELGAVEAVVSVHPEGISIQDIQKGLEVEISRRSLRVRLKRLVVDGRLVMEGSRRWARYFLPTGTGGQEKDSVKPATGVAGEFHPSKLAVQIRAYARRPLMARKPVGYQREFLDAYRPNETAYLSEKERAHLRAVGTRYSGERPAGTLAKRLLSRLRTDLSWNSSRLEGNSYSLQEAKRLIDFGEETEGKRKLEATMILNHKDAIEFLVGSADSIGFDRVSILNLHTLLAKNLLENEYEKGRLRREPVMIGASAYHPPEVTELIEERFDQVLSTAKAIGNPHEQALFAMVHLPHLQPFIDVNKRVSRLAVNIPLIKANLAPLSFTQVSVEAYTEAVLSVYEMNRTELLKDVFVWACEQSALGYPVVIQENVDPDSFRLKHHHALQEIIREIIHEQMDKNSVFKRIAEWTRNNIEAEDQDRFKEIVEKELLDLHEGRFAPYRVTLSQFRAWQECWNKFR